MTERLRLEAEMRDNATPGIRRLKRELEAVQRTPGMESASRWMDAFSEKSRGFVRDGGGISGTMHGIGIGGIAAAASLGELVRQFKELAEHTEDMKELGRQTGLSTDQINQLQYAADKLHVDPAKMDAALTSWSDKMFDFRRHVGDLYGELNQFDPSFARKLSFEDPEKQLHDIFDYLGKIQDPQLQKRWTALFFGSGDLSRVFAEGPKAMNEAWDEAMTKVAKITPELEKQTAALHDSVVEFNTAWTNFETSVGPAVFKGLKETTDDLKTTFDQIERVYEFFQQAKDHPVQAIGKAALDSIDEAAKRNQDPEARAKAGITGPVIVDVPGLASKAIHGIIGDKVLGRGDFAPAQDESDRTSRLSALQSELDRLNQKILDDKNPVSFGVREADTIARIRELHDAISSLRGGSDSQLSGALKPNPLLHKSAYATGLDSGEDDKGGLPSGTRDFVTMIGAGTKLGFLAAFHELQGGGEDGGAGSGGGLIRAAYESGGGGGGSGGGGRAPNMRYGRQHEGAAFTSADGGAVPTGAHDALKDLIAQRETGTTGAGGYDTVYGHAERGGALAPPKPISQMTIADVLAYQREMKPRAGSAAFPVGRGQWTESTLRGLTRGMDPNTLFSPEVQEKLLDRSIAGRLDQGAQGFRSEWDSFRGLSDEAINGAIAGHREAMRSATAAGNGKAPGWMDDRSKRELAGINKELGQDLLAASEATGIHFQIAQGLRNQAEADRNALSGRGVRNSQHLYGAAADLHMLDAQGHETYDRDLYKKFGDAYEAASKAHGGSGRWLGNIGGRWGADIVHFDQGLGFGQTHQRDPFGVGGPTADDVKQGDQEAFKSPMNPFTKARPNIIDEQRKADPMTVRHTGGAVIDIRGLPTSRGTSVKTTGMVTAVNLQRGPTFASPSETG